MKKLRIAIIDVLGLTYDATTVENFGLGGSESAVIYIAKELQQLGCEVTIFNNCTDSRAKAGTYDGVKYVDLAFFNEQHGPDVPHEYHQDIMISSRSVRPFTEPQYHALRIIAKKKILWMHDTFCDGDTLVEDLVVSGQIDEIFTLSDFHTFYVSSCHHGGTRRNPEVLKNKFFITRNGVKRHIEEIDITKKDRHLFVYNASLTKGMLPLVKDIWPEIKKQIPEARLTVIGGYYRFRDDAEPDAQEKEWRELVKDQTLSRLGIQFTGIIPQKDIADILAKATFFLYPGAFPETFGISTLEALSYNVVPITTRFGALEEVAIDKASYLLDYAIEPNSLYPNINKTEQVRKFVELTIRAHNTPYLTAQKQQYASIVHEVSSWSSVAMQWKQKFYSLMDQYLPVEDYRKVSKINTRVHEIFGRRFSNPEEWGAHRTNPEQRIVLIVPFYNAQDYIANCIRSIATQDYDEYNVYLIDDASTDSTSKIVEETLNEFPFDIRARFTTITNKKNVGAVQNQIETMYKAFLERDDIVLLLDGDDALVPRNDIFQFYNTLFDGSVDFAYGSCWSLVDNIPLVAQPYPKAVRDAKAYRQHHFAWGMPYPHLRAFRGQLFTKFVKVQCTPFDEKNIDSTPFKDAEGNWYRAGGDNAVFYNLIEQADPNKIRAVQDIVYLYNDKNPICDYKIHTEEQMKTANAIAPTPITKVFLGLEGLKEKKSHLTLMDAKPPLEWPELQFKPMVKSKRILLAVPTNKYIEVQTFKSIYDLVIPAGYEVEFQYFYGYNISQIRNLIADWGKRYDYLFCVDSDIVLPSDTLVKMLKGDFLSQKPIISGCYVQRLHNNTLELFEANGLGGVKPIDTSRLTGEVIKVDACGFGCVLISSHVLKNIPYPHFVYTEALDHKNTISEDIYFCKKAKEFGYETWADTSIICEHIGSHTYVPSIPPTLERM